MSCVDVPLPALSALHNFVPRCVVCMVEVCGKKCASDGTCFTRFGSAGTCTRVGTVAFRVVPARYCARLIYGVCYAGVVVSCIVRYIVVMVSIRFVFLPVVHAVRYFVV